MKRKTKVLIIILSLLAFLIAAGIFGFVNMSQSASRGAENLVFENIDMNKVADGTYEGEADAGLVFVKVQVTVKDHQITDIELLEHRNGMGKKAEVIVDDMVDKNSFDVDTISGATLSSDTIKSAVSVALKKGVE
jgi:uncharacterized protein with FMN-binding domain